MLNQGRREAGSIVLIEDDPAVAQTISDALNSSEYRVAHASTGSEAVTLLKHSTPDLILLDLMLPDIDGLVLCSNLKKMASTPIVICSATPQKVDAILGLKLGADDFIPKPFDIDELEARLAAVLRRSQVSHPPKPTVRPKEDFTLGNLAIDSARRRATLGRDRLRLTPIEFRLLVTLASRPDEIVRRSDLAIKVWGHPEASIGRTIDVHVRRLRMKLSTTPTKAPQIVAVRGMRHKITASD